MLKLKTKASELRLLLHVSNVCQCWGLLRLLRLYWPVSIYLDPEDVVCHAEEECRLKFPVGPDDVLDDWEAEVTMMILEHVARFGVDSTGLGPLLPTHHFLDEILERRILGSASKGLMFEVLCGTNYSKVLHMRNVCSNILRVHILHARNCCALYCSARHLRVTDVQDEALSVIKSHFTDLVSSYPDQVQLLPREWFQEITSCPTLQVENEVTVFDGIVAWIEGCEAARSPDLAFLMGACCRLPLLSLHDLHLLDSHQMVRSCSLATAMVAKVYIRHCTTGYKPEEILSLHRTSHQSGGSVNDSSRQSRGFMEGAIGWELPRPWPMGSAA
eukprot:jgi/Botrbrau1/20409/Bobra.0006s0066.1